MSERERADYIGGRVQALLAFALAAAATHPERDLLRVHFEKSSQALLAGIEVTLASDKAVEGFQEVTQKILSILQG
jgi:hypothetical protein